MTDGDPRIDAESIGEDPFADLDDSGFPVAADEPAAMPEPTINAAPDAPPARAIRSRVAFRVALLGGVLVVACFGWLGWEYMQDREALSALEADLLAARDAAAASATKTEDSGEHTQAAALQERVAATISAPWWQGVASRIIEADRIESARAQGDELAQQSNLRRANRDWWRAQVASVDEALSSPSRTIPTVMAAADAFADAVEPNSGAGGFSPDDRATIAERCAADAAQLLEQQDASIAALDAAITALRESSTVERHAELARVLDEPLPIDRNPPELAEAQTAARQQSADIREFLLTRDRLLGEVVETVGVLESFDLNDGSPQAVAAMAQRLDALELPADPRFDAIRERASRAEDLAMAALARLHERDEALAWIDTRREELDAIDSLESLAQFTDAMASDHPSSDLPRAQRAVEELAGRISMRRTTLEDEKRLRDESLARAATFEVGWTECEEQLASGMPATAADALSSLTGETPDQAERLARGRAQFGARAKARLLQLVAEARASAHWQTSADAIRRVLGSPTVAALAPALGEQIAGLWEEASLAEDHELYLELLGAAGAPLAELAPRAERYLNEARLRGATAPMRAHVERLLDALKVPGVTIELEGIEWADPQCSWNSPRTEVTVMIGEESFPFLLSDIEPKAVSPLGGESWMRDAASTPVRFGVSGYFDCEDDDGVFAGSGALSMDDLACGGRLALPFWNDADPSSPAHNLLLIAIPDAEVHAARQLPAWLDPRAPTPEGSDEMLAPSQSLPVDPTSPHNERAVTE